MLNAEEIREKREGRRHARDVREWNPEPSVGHGHVEPQSAHARDHQRSPSD